MQYTRGLHARSRTHTCGNSAPFGFCVSPQGWAAAADACAVGTVACGSAAGDCDCADAGGLAPNSAAESSPSPAATVDAAAPAVAPAGVPAAAPALEVDADLLWFAPCCCRLLGVRSDVTECVRGCCGEPYDVGISRVHLVNLRLPRGVITYRLSKWAYSCGWWCSRALQVCCSIVVTHCQWKCPCSHLGINIQRSARVLPPLWVMWLRRRQRRRLRRLLLDAVVSRSRLVRRRGR